MSKTKLKVGISPCPNDTFIFGGLIHKEVQTELDYEFTYLDVQTLNEKVLTEEFDVLKISYGHLKNALELYSLLYSGGAMGFGCGPLLLGSEQSTLDANSSVVIPGQNTTAHYLYQFWAENNQISNGKDFALFDEVYRTLVDKSISFGVAIHECRFTYEQDRLHLVEDLGEFWEKETSNPIPLGGIICKNSLGKEVAKQVDSDIRQSIGFAEKNKSDLMKFMKDMAQIKDENVVLSHVQTYVNDFSRDLGSQGLDALETLMKYQNVYFEEHNILAY